MSFKHYPNPGTTLCDMHDGLDMDRIDEVFGVPTMIISQVRLDTTGGSKLIEQILKQDPTAVTTTYYNKLLTVLNYPGGLTGGVTLGYSYDDRIIVFYTLKAQV